MKNTKVNTNSRRLLAIMLAAIIGFSFAACGDEDTGDPTGPGGGDGSIPAELVGRWGYISMSIEIEQFKINADGTGTQGDPASITPTNVKWSVNGNRLSYNYIPKTGTGSADYSITDGKLTFSNMGTDPLSNYFQYFITQATIPFGLGPLVKLGGGVEEEDPHEHDWSAWETISEGVKKRTCNDLECGETEIDLLYALGAEGPGGGKIFYRSETGFTMTDDDSTAYYLEAAPADMAAKLKWLEYSSDAYSVTINTAVEIGTGRKNTALILDADPDAPAAKACANYGADNGLAKNDWFLPSIDELNSLYRNKSSVGDFKEDHYWSSSLYNTYQAWRQNFFDINNMNFSIPYQDDKENTFYVRAIRAF